MDRATLLQALHQALGSISPGVAELVWERTDRLLHDDATSTLPESAWIAALQTALTDVPPQGHLQRLAELHWDELWLCTALARGDPHALEQFEAALMPEVLRAIRRLALSADDREEVGQHIRVQLLVSAPPKPPMILQYGGHGSLAAWIRTVSARLALNHRRYTRVHTNVDDVPESALPAAPEFSQLRHEHRILFVESLKQAFCQLDRRSRTLLRLRYSDQMPSVALARAYAVHESTMSRWLADARKQMAANFETIVSGRLGEVPEFADLLSLLQNHLDLSLASLFMTPRPGEGEGGGA